MVSAQVKELSSRRATPERVLPCEGAGEPASHREETIHALSISRCGQSSTVGGACEPEHNLNVGPSDCNITSELPLRATW